VQWICHLDLLPAVLCKNRHDGQPDVSGNALPRDNVDLRKKCVHVFIIQSSQDGTHTSLVIF
jgi:hypothetical protein